MSFVLGESIIRNNMWRRHVRHTHQARPETHIKEIGTGGASPHLAFLCACSLVQRECLREAHELRENVLHEVQLIDLSPHKMDVLNDALTREDGRAVEGLV